MLKISGLNKSYAKNDIKAVDNLSLEVRPGEIFGFIGPNGAGKTTTIKMICGILAPDSGRIEIAGHSITDDPIAAKRSLGYVPDNHEVYEMLSGAEYLDFMADMYGVSTADRKERIHHYLSLFSLSDAGSDPIKSYSHGMKQKLVITGALLHKPALWILDEPMTGLDPKSALLLKQEMRAHCNEGNTVFFSTHVLEVAEKLCDRIGIINHGRLVAVGTLDELRSGSDESLESIFMECTEGSV
ncbi:MAG: ABC transporter ATP-binding protein [Firmicutes bacterium]|nr:ABC transporter ATP-binding protein [Bacillota bacterium]